MEEAVLLPLTVALTGTSGAAPVGRVELICSADRHWRYLTSLRPGNGGCGPSIQEYPL
jgi:hypothetical protein